MLDFFIFFFPQENTSQPFWASALMLRPRYQQYHHSTIAVLLWHCHNTAEHRQVPQHQCSGTITAPSRTTTGLPGYTSTTVTLPGCCHNPMGVGRETLGTHQARSLQDHGGPSKEPEDQGKLETQKPSGVLTRSTTTHVHSWWMGDPLQGSARAGCTAPTPQDTGAPMNSPLPPPLPAFPPRPGACPLPRQPALPKAQRTVTLALSGWMEKRGGSRNPPHSTAPFFGWGASGTGRGRGQRQTKGCTVQHGVSPSIATNSHSEQTRKDLCWGETGFSLAGFPAALSCGPVQAALSSRAREHSTGLAQKPPAEP